nr:hypothetical protein [Paraburkholderia sp.]
MPKINVDGEIPALVHPLGASGCKLITTSTRCTRGTAATGCKQYARVVVRSTSRSRNVSSQH